MSDKKKTKVLHVDKLVIHAKEVDFIQERKEIERPRETVSPWDFIWGRPRPVLEAEEEHLDKKRNAVEEADFKK